jgi:allantoin racemase
MARVLVLVPATRSPTSMAIRGSQLEAAKCRPDVVFEFRPIRFELGGYDNEHDYLLGKLGLLDAGIDAQRDGYDALVVDSVSDGGVELLRSVLDIPVIGAGRPSYYLALVLAPTFSLLIQHEILRAGYERQMRDMSVRQQCASIRSIDLELDYDAYLTGNEDVAFSRLLDAGLRCVEEDQAGAIVLPVSLFQAHSYLAERLPVPVINPGAIAYRTIELILDMGLRHSSAAYVQPQVVERELVHRMVESALGRGLA